MRMTSMLAGFAIVCAACGGEKKAPEGQPATTPPDQQQPAQPAGGGGAGKSHDVEMVLEGSSYKYNPAQLTVGPNDVIRYHNKSGGPHNVAFWEDSIPKGAASHITVPDPMAPLSSKLAVAPDEVLEVKLSDAPKGAYKFHCTPHLALGMKGSLTVQ